MQYNNFNTLIAGCDEVGRGCLAGPVVAAAVILPSNSSYFQIKDSKKLSPKERIILDSIIREEAIDWAIGLATVEEIDELNILQASHLAMHRAIEKLAVSPSMLLIDGKHFLPFPGIEHMCIIRGDEQANSIAAASIIAKVYRDQYMQELALAEPGYNWEENMGYPTICHRRAIEELGISSHYRKSFSPVNKQLQLHLWM